ncbi:hypothetical protein PSACC_01868 [Paramicrosporidium saccamoebae]|uniref:Uncharacterized protein n=1 Tax=Paramicrosporidium saccamoebae TaxID=1246581 RepID=A0A2H9TKQ9_9FUNG|nr:hypothetical protein PSACC_01868 [Paramicrosporidium saccamoebae]
MALTKKHWEHIETKCPPGFAEELYTYNAPDLRSALGSNNPANISKVYAIMAGMKPTDDFLDSGAREGDLAIVIATRQKYKSCPSEAALEDATKEGHWMVVKHAMKKCNFCPNQSSVDIGERALPRPLPARNSSPRGVRLDQTSHKYITPVIDYRAGPVGYSLPNDRPTQLALRERNRFFYSLLSGKFKEIVLNDQELTLMIYNAVSKILFADIQEFRKPACKLYEGDLGLEEIIKPLVECIEWIVQEWPVDSKLFLLFIHEDFARLFTQLWYSPDGKERTLVTALLLSIIKRLESDQPASLDAFIHGLLQIMGRLLGTLSDNRYMTIRPVLEIFVLLRSCFAVSAIPCWFASQHLVPFLTNALVINYEAELSQFLLQMIDGSSDSMQIIEAFVKTRLQNVLESVEMISVNVISFILLNGLDLPESHYSMLATKLVDLAHTSSHHSTKVATITLLKSLLVYWAFELINPIASVLKSLAIWILDESLESTISPNLVDLWRKLSFGVIPVICVHKGMKEIRSLVNRVDAKIDHESSTKWDWADPQASIKARLQIYNEVLPAGEYHSRPSEVHALLNRRNFFFIKVITSESLARIIINDRELSALLYRALCNILFFKVEELNKTQGDRNTQPDVDDILIPAFHWIKEILFRWPAESAVYRALTSESFTNSLRKLLHSPQLSERALFTKHVHDALEGLVSREGNVSDYVSIVLVQLGLALQDSKKGDEVYGRPLKEVFRCYVESLKYANYPQVAQFVFEYLIPFMKSPFIKEHVTDVTALLNYVITRAPTNADLKRTVKRILELSWRSRSERVEEATVRIALSVALQPAISQGFNVDFLTKSWRLTRQTLHTKVLTTVVGSDFKLGRHLIVEICDWFLQERNENVIPKLAQLWQELTDTVIPLLGMSDNRHFIGCSSHIFTELEDRPQRIGQLIRYTTCMHSPPLVPDPVHPVDQGLSCFCSSYYASARSSAVQRFTWNYRDPAASVQALINIYSNVLPVHPRDGSDLETQSRLEAILERRLCFFRHAVSQANHTDVLQNNESVAEAFFQMLQTILFSNTVEFRKEVGQRKRSYENDISQVTAPVVELIRTMLRLWPHGPLTRRFCTSQFIIAASGLLQSPIRRERELIADMFVDFLTTLERDGSPMLTEYATSLLQQIGLVFYDASQHPEAATRRPLDYVFKLYELCRRHVAPKLLVGFMKNYLGPYMKSDAMLDFPDEVFGLLVGTIGSKHQNGDEDEIEEHIRGAWEDEIEIGGQDTRECENGIETLACGMEQHSSDILDFLLTLTMLHPAEEQENLMFMILASVVKTCAVADCHFQKFITSSFKLARFTKHASTTIMVLDHLFNKFPTTRPNPMTIQRGSFAVFLDGFISYILRQDPTSNLFFALGNAWREMDQNGAISLAQQYHHSADSPLGERIDEVNNKLREHPPSSE